ncbi:MAG: hypothetical protein Kow00109_13140 [Acidobacteriota bacterium]
MPKAKKRERKGRAVDVNAPETTPWRHRLSVLGAFFLGGVLVIATVGKLLEPVLFVEQIRHEGLEIFFSAETVALIALALETGLGIALLLGVRHAWVLGPAAALVAFFVSLTGRNYYLVLTGARENSADCGCFGVFMQRTATEAFWQDLLLLVPPLILAFLDRPAWRHKPPAWKSAAAVLGTAFVVVWAGAAIGWPGEGEPVVTETAAEGPVFLPNGDFLLEIDGTPESGAQVLECEITAQFLVASRRLPKVLLLDPTNQYVYELDLAPGDVLDRPRYVLDQNVPATGVGPFDVTSEGLAFSYAGHVLRLKNR